MLTHLSINLFPTVMLLVIYISNQRNITITPDRRRFDMLAIWTMGLMLVNTMSYGLEGTQGDGVNTALWILHMAHAFLVVSVAADWFIYVSFRLRTGVSKRHVRRMRKYMTVLKGTYAVFVLLTPQTHWLFRITEENICENGRLYYISYLISITLLLTTLVASVKTCLSEISSEQRNECYYLVVCAMIALCGMVFQHILDDWWLAAPSLALAILFIYLNTQNRQITTDALTGLNNRREFDQQIVKKAEQFHGNNWGILMLDVDDFKSINDTLGHAVGDEALWEAADILRRTLGEDKTFLSRYGGDEFAVIGAWESEEEVHMAISRVEEEAARFNELSGKKYKLSLSIGYAMWDEVRMLEGLVEKADERMYMVKTGRKSARMRQS